MTAPSASSAPQGVEEALARFENAARYNALRRNDYDGTAEKLRVLEASDERVEKVRALVIRSATTSTALNAALADNARLREAHRHAGALMFALLGRPDVTHLFGPFEKMLFEAARVSNNAALAAPHPTAAEGV